MRSSRALAVTLVLLLPACSVFRHGPPDWLEGNSKQYPANAYLIGVGQADNKQTAADRAYSAVARVFNAQVTAQSQDWESFLILEKKGQASSERRLTLDQVTKVSTDKVVENIRVLETWRNPRSGIEYALAGMDRAQAGTAMLERITALDQTIDSEVREARASADKLTRVRNLRRAIKNLVLREAYNTDLRVIRTSGRGVEPPYRVADLTAELEQFLARSVVVTVEVTGEQAEQTRRAVMEGLIREGLPVGTAADGAPDLSRLELLVKGTVGLWDVSMPDPQFRYARWCTDFTVTERDNQHVVGAVSIGGREGHINISEARAKAFRVMQQELTSNLAKSLASYVYGQADPPKDLPPAACPK